MRNIAGSPPESGWLRHESLTLLSLNNGAREVTVIGKIPAETAKLIATSIHATPATKSTSSTRRALRSSASSQDNGAP